MCGGGCGRQWDIFVAAPRGRSATEDDRRALQEWLSRKTFVSDVRIGPLVDAWHD